MYLVFEGGGGGGIADGGRGGDGGTELPIFLSRTKEVEQGGRGELCRENGGRRGFSDRENNNTNALNLA